VQRRCGNGGAAVGSGSTCKREKVKGVRVHLATIPSDLTGGKEAGVYQVDPWGGRRDHAWKVGSLHFVERKANRDDDTEGSGGQGSEFAAGDAS
jgi:hypothetical protein